MISTQDNMEKGKEKRAFLPVEPIDQVIFRLKLFDALIDMSKFLFD